MLPDGGTPVGNTDDIDSALESDGRDGEIDDLLDAVKEDPDLLPEEKETTLRFDKRDDYATVYTAEAGLTRRLLAHDHVDVEGLTVLDEDSRYDVLLGEYAGGSIVGVRVRIPVGALQVKLRPRSSKSHAEIVTDRVLADGGLCQSKTARGWSYE